MIICTFMSLLYGFAQLWCYVFVFFKQKTAYEMRISDWSSDVCSSDLDGRRGTRGFGASRLRSARFRAARLWRCGADACIPGGGRACHPACDRPDRKSVV